ncbi:MAG: hypothetical protein HWQ23_11900, partial [Nostoc sp. JL33]|uniref:hypothetical protein n=1 Tax=Nostoc sp. JL33 TaxID=2815396 RepID=UPI0025F29262
MRFIEKLVKGDAYGGLLYETLRERQRICYFGDAYGWLRLRICYFGDAYGWLRLRICYFGEPICYFGDAYGWLRLR